MTLKGSTADFPLDVLIRLLADTKKTGELSLRGTAGEGALGVADGRVVTAVFGDEPPIPALGAIFDLGTVEFEFTPWDQAPPANLEGDLGDLRRKAAEHREWLAGVRAVVPHDRLRFRLSELAAEQGAVTFTSDRWHVVLAVNGERDVNDIAEQLHIDRYAALDVLAGLVRDAVIETVEPSHRGEASAAVAEKRAPVVEAPAPMREPEPPMPEPAAAIPEPAAPPTFEPAAPVMPEAPAMAEPPAEHANAWTTPAADQWAPAAPEPPVDDRLAALFGPAPAEPAAPAPPAAGQSNAPATSEWGTPRPAADAWTSPTAEPAAPPPVDDPRLGALTLPPLPETRPAPAPTANEWAAPPTIEAPRKKGGGLFGRFGGAKEQATDAAAVESPRGSSRVGQLAAFSNALLSEYNSGQYGKNKIAERMPGLLMRVDEQADPIDRPLPVLDDRLDVEALERVSLSDTQAAPYLAMLVTTIYGDAEKAFGRDKAKRGYKAALQQVFGADVSALGGADLAGKLPKV